ncbi:hypothetical protein QVD17_28740 [Tagetes erecta]|uniref:Reverse transcriptase zinc-binding domain-containing protein n=1 Tax=Tagetes erecta TaxID=13708 RepID=A0AAD8KAY4_TARER|nr:hypothetical protein QVD17_28740 [Tagetes erecta]
MEDQWSWSGNGANEFSSNNVKKLIENNNPAFVNCEVAWEKTLPVKVNFFCWCALINRLPTREAISRRGIIIENQACLICNSHPETVEHLLLHCPGSNMIWTSLSQWCNIPSFHVDSIKGLLDHSNNINTTTSARKKIKLIFITAMWVIWKARNDMVFNNKLWNINRLVDDVKTWSSLWINNREKNGISVWNSWSTHMSS